MNVDDSNDNLNIGLQSDESTNVSNCSQLLIFAGYIYKGNLKEELLMFGSLETAAKAINVLDKSE